MQRDSNRPRRVGEVLKRELALIIRQELDHPRANDITLTAVDMSPDLRSARLFFTFLDSDEQAKEMTQVLNQASGFFRHHLRGRVQLRGIPKLRFIYDESIERGRRLSALIDKVSSEISENEKK